MLTKEEELFIELLTSRGIRFQLNSYYSGDTWDKYVYIYDSKENKQFFLKHFHTVRKQRSFDGTITGQARLGDMEIALWEWDVCKIVGTVKKHIPEQPYVPAHTEVVNVTDCDLRINRYNREEVEFNEKG